ncbi:MAG: UvrD-helicase domain-containing protein [Oscillospiraceae bacterium]
MSEKWTSDQRLAIDARGGGILVAAAAGSGKTSVLVERIISIITDENNPIDADRLLVVTFTNAAAAEMSARVKKSLARLIAVNPENRRLRRQQMLLARAQISTIDAFCSTLLREHFSELDLAPDFSVGNDAYIQQLRATAMDAVLNEMYADKDSGVEHLSDLFGRSRTDRNTAVLIDRLYDFETTLAFPERWEHRCMAELECGDSLAHSEVGRYMLSFAKRALESAVSICNEALRLAGEDEILFANYGDTLSLDLQFAKRLLEFAEQGEWDACNAMANSYSQIRPGMKKGADETLGKSVKGLRDEVRAILQKQICEKCFCCSQGDYIEDKALMLEPMRVLFDGLHRFEQKLTSLKQAKKMFEFSDLERMAVLLLGGADGAKTDIASELSARFEYVMVDEYQDTNEIQDLIFSLISRDEKNLFCVGDVKQSIYSFRRADPEIFLARRAKSSDSAQGLFPMKITLAENFRSSAAVVEAVNMVFEPVMTSFAGGTDYCDGEQLAANPDAGLIESCGMEVHLINEGENAEPNHIANIISDMISEGYTVETKQGTRACRESDFCILLRSPKEKAQRYKDALNSAGIRVWTDGTDNLYENSEVSVLVSLLRVIDNPRRDVELAAVMLSPLFGFKSDDLARMKLSGRRADLYTLVLSSGDERCKELVDTLALFRRKQSLFAVDELIRYAVDYTDAEILLCAGDELSRRKNNIRLFIETATEFAKTGDGSLSMFLRVCERAAQSGKTATRAFTPPDDAVCITSIHKSKGLEWGIIFLANADKRFNISDSFDSSMLFDAALGCGARVRAECEDKSALYSRKTASYTALSLASGAKTTSEEMRVLYVALTRARQKLFVTAELSSPEEKLAKLACFSANEKIEPYLVAMQSGYISWILLALLKNYRQAPSALEEKGEFCADSIKIKIVRNVTPRNRTQSQTHETQPAESGIEALNERARFIYSRLELADIPTKLTVTELTKDKSGIILNKPSFVCQRLSAAQRGTAIHLFMQCADYKKAEESVEQELKRLVEHEYISKQAADEIDIQKLNRLFKSEFGKMIAQSEIVLREYSFIDSISASEIKPLSDKFEDERVMIQGIADCIIMREDGAVLIDYKSDRVTSPMQLAERYSMQLRLYKKSLDKRLSVPIVKCIIYSFELGYPVELDFK